MTSIATTLGKAVLARRTGRRCSKMSANASIAHQTGANNPGAPTTMTSPWTLPSVPATDQDQRFSLAGITGASFAFLDGSDYNAIEFNTFLTANLGALNHVSAGGHLF